ncbi:DnaJ domain-containing protein [Halorubrum sp. JWXQ-INN 858]|uniref:DnaJ domain-containing protein n=1 Tax=Halorubrum sp. JWXQ-INN 858 TaxID=2690782 RepID=UPI00135C5029|nr:DnaJ domain-containing protein [Halorubrum sp. JWXQ-INN 858]MWV63887.1 DnaJ domain-containing protein [Halorubrum sp. JWXQ-INN 858]
MTESYYEVLGVDSDADVDEIEQAYRELIHEWHPDVSDQPNARERFLLIKEAREVLTDDAQRARYDRIGHAAYVGDGDPTGDSGGSDRGTGDSETADDGTESNERSGRGKRSGRGERSDDRRRGSDGRTGSGRDDGSGRSGRSRSSQSAAEEYRRRRQRAQSQRTRGGRSSRSRSGSDGGQGNGGTSTTDGTTASESGSTSGADSTSTSGSGSETDRDTARRTGWGQPSATGSGINPDAELLKYPAVLLYWAIGSAVSGLLFAIVLLPVYLQYRRKKYTDRILSEGTSPEGFVLMIRRLVIGIGIVSAGTLVFLSGVGGETVQGAALFGTLIGLYLCLRYFKETMVRDWFNAEGTSNPVAWDFASRAPLMVLPLLGGIDPFGLGSVVQAACLFAPAFVPAVYLFRTERRGVVHEAIA